MRLPIFTEEQYKRTIKKAKSVEIPEEQKERINDLREKIRKE